MVRFAAFLREAEAVEESRQQGRFLGFAVFVFVLAAFIMILVLRDQAGRFGLVWLCIALLIAYKAYKWARQRDESMRERTDALQAHYIEMIREFSRYSTQGTLNERIHPALATQLETAATSYFQVKEWLGTKSSLNVLGSETHREVQQSIRKAMREVVFSLHGQYRPVGMQRKKWNSMVAADPEALAASEDLARVCGLILQLAEVAKKTEALGKTITLMDQITAIQQAIAELEETSYSAIKALPPRRP